MLVPGGILLVGASGMLGQDVRSECERRGWPVHAPTRDQLDICDPESVAQIVTNRWPTRWCINCAAYTAVDRAEEQPDRALALNALGPSYLGRAASLAGMRLLHMSTDFVFDGTQREPYSEESIPNPCGAYGRSKLAGEEAVLATGPLHLVLRSSWLFGAGGPSFPSRIVEAWLAGRPLRVVDDQVGTPTYTVDLARVILDVVAAEPEGGIYHAAGPEAMSWHRFATLAVEAYARAIGGSEREIAIEPIPSSSWPTQAVRPAYSVLGTDRLRALGVAPMRPIREALEEFAASLLAKHQT